jgi:hypothetical protein
MQYRLYLKEKLRKELLKAQLDTSKQLRRRRHFHHEFFERDHQ